VNTADSPTAPIRFDASAQCCSEPWPLQRLVGVSLGCLTQFVVVYGIASSLSRDIEDFYPTAAQIFADEPELEGRALWVEHVELELSPN
jgi:hypothetical protein